MANASYSPVTDTITVQPGVHWGDAMTAVEPFGVSVIAGRARYETRTAITIFQVLL